MIMPRLYPAVSAVGFVLALATTALAQDSAATPPAQTSNRTVAPVDCALPETACYPWRIEKGADQTVLMENLPTNVVTAASYRICVCPPASGVGLTMEFADKKVEIGKIELNEGGVICRDFKVMTSTRSRLTLNRIGGSKDAGVNGCYN